VNEADPFRIEEDQYPYWTDDTAPELWVPTPSIDLQSRFRAAYLSTDPGDVTGAAAFHKEAVQLLLLHQQAMDLLNATGAADLAELYADDAEMLAALPQRSRREGAVPPPGSTMTGRRRSDIQ
jgi:hypothetical protein